VRSPRCAAGRSEIGALLTVGWTRTAIFRAVLAELCLIGLVAGIVGTALAALIAWRFELSLSLWWTLPGRAARHPPRRRLGARTRLDRLPRHTARRTQPTHLRAATRTPDQQPLDARARQRTSRPRPPRARSCRPRCRRRRAHDPARDPAGPSRAYSSTRCSATPSRCKSHNTDFTAAALTIGLAALALADVLYLNRRDRAAELVTLRTLGWNERHLATLVGLEALALGLAGSLTGALTGIAIGAGLLHVPAGPLTIAALLAAIGGLTASLIASLLPLSQINRLTPPTALAEE